VRGAALVGAPAALRPLRLGGWPGRLTLPAPRRAAPQLSGVMIGTLSKAGVDYDYPEGGFLRLLLPSAGACSWRLQLARLREPRRPRPALHTAPLCAAGGWGMEKWHSLAEANKLKLTNTDYFEPEEARPEGMADREKDEAEARARAQAADKAKALHRRRRSLAAGGSGSGQGADTGLMMALQQRARAAWRWLVG
jgi:hypothetical protein